MKTKLTTVPHINGRTRIALEVELSEDEIEAAERRKCAMHFDSTDPVPCQFYQMPDPAINVVKGIPEYNGVPHKAYILGSARRVPLNRAIPRKTLLRIFVPGKLDLGYIQKNEVTLFENWWEKTAQALTTGLKSKFFEVNPEKAEIKEQTPKEKIQEAKLNPMDPTEKNGVRKRGMEIY